MRASAERIFKSHFPKATIRRHKTHGGKAYFLVRKHRGAFMWSGGGKTKAAAWANACERCNLTALYDGKCPRSKHGLDYAGQPCDLCAKATA